MTDLTFARPWVLLALAALPLLAAAWLLGVAHARRDARALSRGRIPRPPHLAALLTLAAAGLAVVASAQPQWGEEHTRVPRSGAELVIALDVSRSMDVQDVQPSRMEATKAMLQSLLGRLGGDRVGLVVFGGDARVRFPLTTDLAAASQVIGTIETAPVIVAGGSSSASGLTVALDSFEEDSEANRVILLITDGDDLGADPVAAAERLQASGVELLVAGAGTAEGGTIPVFDRTEQQFSAKLDEAGNPIITRLNEDLLRTLAVASGGRYLGATMDSVPGAVVGRLGALERTRIEEETRPIPIERYHWFAGAALAMLVLASLAESIPRPSRRATVGAFAVGAALLAGCATRAHDLNEDGRDAFEAGDNDAAINHFLAAQAESPDDPRIRLNLAAAYHQAARYEEASLAARTLLVESDPELRARAHASIGHHLFAAGDLPGALDSFRQALVEDPEDEASRHDYEVILRLLQPPDDEEPAPGETPGGQTPEPTAPGEGPGGSATPSPGSTAPGATPGGNRPGNEEELERRLADIDAEIARIREEAGEDIEAQDAIRILELLAERQRIASVRDALAGGGDPNDY